MNRLQKNVASAITAGAVLLNTVLPVLAGSSTTLVISGNGSSTDNDATVAIVNTTTVVQENDADIDNDVNVMANTGDNSADDNTGGDVEIDTGDVEVEVGIANTANSNVADVSGCCDQEFDVLISGNGTESDNEVKLQSVTETALFQGNDADIDNDVDVRGNTGENDADDNTGGDVEIKTGDVEVGVAIVNTANSNSARVGDGGGSMSLSAWIVDNGSHTDNDIELALLRSILLVQENNADIDNDVDVKANTGKNDADDNTGGDVEIDTGDIAVRVGFDTLANFNMADLDCDCFGDVWAKIAGNGTDSDNEIKAQLLSALDVFQENSCGGGHGWPQFGSDWGWRGGKGNDCVDNDADIMANTGKNDADDNTGDSEGGDPSIETGDIEVEAVVETSGNSNVFGDDPGFDFDLPFGGLSINLTLNLGNILDLLGL